MEILLSWAVSAPFFKLQTILLNQTNFFYFLSFAVFLAVSFLMLVVIVILFERHQYDGKYVTQEDKDADIYHDPDEAVINSVTGPLVTKRKEWFV